MKKSFLKLILFGNFVHMQVHSFDELVENQQKLIESARQEAMCDYILYDLCRLESADPKTNMWCSVTQTLYENFKCTDDHKEEVRKNFEMHQRLDAYRSNIDSSVIDLQQEQILKQDIHNWQKFLQLQHGKLAKKLGLTNEELKTMRALWKKEYFQARNDCLRAKELKKLKLNNRAA